MYTNTDSVYVYVVFINYDLWMHVYRLYNYHIFGDMITSNIIFEPLHADNEKTSHNRYQTLPQTDLEIATLRRSVVVRWLNVDVGRILMNHEAYPYARQYTPRKTTMSSKKGTISIGNTSSNHWFSGDLLVFRGVIWFSLNGSPTHHSEQFI